MVTSRRQHQETKSFKDASMFWGFFRGGGGGGLSTGSPVYTSGAIFSPGFGFCLLLSRLHNLQIHLGSTFGDLLTAIVLPSHFDPRTFSSIREVHAIVCSRQALEPTSRTARRRRPCSTLTCTHPNIHTYMPFRHIYIYSRQRGRKIKFCIPEEITANGHISKDTTTYGFC